MMKPSLKNLIEIHHSFRYRALVDNRTSHLEEVTMLKHPIHYHYYSLKLTNFYIAKVTDSNNYETAMIQDCPVY